MNTYTAATSADAAANGSNKQQHDPLTPRTSWQLMACLLTAHMLCYAPIFTPADFARMGWLVATGWICVVAGFTAYSGALFTEQRELVPQARVFGDIGQAAYGRLGRHAAYVINYTMLAGFPIVSLLLATETLQLVVSGMVQGCSWQFALVVQAIFLALGQVQSLHSIALLSHVGNAGMLLLFLGVSWGLLQAGPCPGAITQLLSSRGLPAAVVGMMHVVYGFGGQFAFVEFMSDMSHPPDFTKAVSVVAVLEVAGFVYMGVLGYWYGGSSLTGLITSHMNPTEWTTRIANLGVFLQVIIKGAISQNVWIHALLHMMMPQRNYATTTAGNTGQDKFEASVGNCRMNCLPVSDATSAEPVESTSAASTCFASCSCSCSSKLLSRQRVAWFVVSAFVAGYSYLLATALPFVDQVVAVLVSLGYPLVAFVLPCLFLIRLHAQEGQPLALPRLILFRVLIAGSLCVTGLGLASSIFELKNRASMERPWACLDPGHAARFTCNI